MSRCPNPTRVWLSLGYQLWSRRIRQLGRIRHQTPYAKRARRALQQRKRVCVRGKWVLA